MEIELLEMQKRFYSFVDRAERGETFTILRDGRPVAQMVRAAESKQIRRPGISRRKPIRNNKPRG